MQPLIRPSNWNYLAGIGLIAVGGLAGARFHATRMVAVSEGLTQIIVPGSAAVRLTGPAHGTIFLEHRSVVGTQMFATGTTLGGLRCTLTGPAGGEVPLDMAWVPLSYAGELRQGRAVYDFWIPASETYRLTAEYAPGTAGSSMVLAVGQGFLGDLSAPIVGGAGAAAGGILAGITWVLVVWRMRERSRRRVYGRYG